MNNKTRIEKEISHKVYKAFRYLTFRINNLVNLYNSHYDDPEFQDKMFRKIEALQDFFSATSKKFLIRLTHIQDGYAPPKNLLRKRKQTMIQKCQICSKIIFLSKFPKDFPEKYRICCDCLDTAQFIYSKLNINSQEFKEMLAKVETVREQFKLSLKYSTPAKREDRKIHYEKYKERFDELFLVKK